jgi:osmotically-inducible protein OsmY
MAGQPPAALPLLALLALLAAIAFAAGCGRGREGAMPAGVARRDAGRAVKEVEVREDPVKTGIEAADAGLAGKVRSRLDGDAQLRRLPIEVDAEAGRVTLWGRVGSAEERAAAEQLARRTPGVTSVIDHIKISPRG